MRKLFFLVTLVCVVSSIATAGGDGESTEAAAPGTGQPSEAVAELKIGTGWDATNPGDYNPYGMWEPSTLVYESLVALDGDSNPGPCLAEAWSVSDDGLEWEFNLVSDVDFHDGTPFNARSVIINYERFIDTSWSKLKPYVEDMSAPENHTLVMKLVKPHPLLLIELANVRYGIISPEVIVKDEDADTESGMSGMSAMGSGTMGSGGSSGMGERGTDSMSGDSKGMESSAGESDSMGTRGGMGSGSSSDGMESGSMPPAMAAALAARGEAYVVSEPIGTGPYIWDADAYVRNRTFSVRANAEYRHGEPRIKRITWEVIPDPGARTMALESGRIQMTGQSTNAAITGENLISLKRNPELAVTMAPNWGTRLLIINHMRPPFDRREVRKALRHAINYTELQTVVGEMATICPGPFGSGTILALPEARLPEYDPESAIAMFDEAGIVDSDGDGYREYDGEKVSLEIISTKHPTLSVLLQEQLKQVGIEIRIASKEQASQFAVLEQMDFDIASHANIPSFSLDLYEQFADDGDWSMHLGDPELQALLGEFRAAAGFERLKELAHEIQRRVLDKHIILFAVNERKVAVYEKDLGRFRFPPEEWVGALQEIWRM